VLVRFLVRDEERQFTRAQRLLRREDERGEPVFVSHLVLLETEWVLRSRYGLSKAEIPERSLGCSSRQNCRSKGSGRSSRR
jgi:predicted nucleic-acid-binding protein